jgi:hypothetical protein
MNWKHVRHCLGKGAVTYELLATYTARTDSSTSEYSSATVTERLDFRSRFGLVTFTFRSSLLIRTLRQSG